MRSDQDHATNIFARVFSYTPRSEGRTPLEDFCTESLAWCIIHSADFRERFLKNINTKLIAKGRLPIFVSETAASVRVDTQFPFRGSQDIGKGASSPGRFDLLLRSSAGSEYALVIEVKVNVDTGLESQLRSYSDALKTQGIWGHYNARYVLSLTPSTRHPENAHAHLSWGEVETMIDEMQKKNVVHCQFSEFLKLRHLGNIKIMKLTSQLNESFQQTAKYFSQFNAIFERFREQQNLKALFLPRNVSKPFLEYYEDEPNRWFANLSFYTVGNDTGGPPSYYAGMFAKKTRFWLYMQTEQTGSVAESSVKCANAEVAKAVSDTKDLFKKNVFYWPDKKLTSILFCRELTNDMEPDDIIQWYETIAEEICKISR